MVKDTATKIAIIFIALTLVGWTLTTFPVHHSYEYSLTTENNTATYKLTSDYTADGYSVLIRTDGDYDINRLIMYHDENYYSIVDWQDQYVQLGYLQNHLYLCSFTNVGYADTEGMLNEISTGDVRHTALLFASGCYPEPIYDGTDSCPLIEWLENGGTVINMFGSLGKYISSGPEESDCFAIDGFAKLFTGVDDDSIIREADAFDPETFAYTAFKSNAEFMDPLHLFFNEYSFGIKTENIPYCVNLGYTSEDGFSCASVFKSHNGMIINFAVTITKADYETTQMAQVIASGIDYTAKIQDWDAGRTNMTGTFEIPECGSYHLYGYIGASAPVYGHKLMI